MNSERREHVRIAPRAGSSGSCVFIFVHFCVLLGDLRHFQPQASKYCYDRYEKLQPSTSHLFRTTNFETSSLLLIFNPTKTEDATNRKHIIIHHPSSIHHHSTLIIYIMLSDFRAKKVFDCKLQPLSIFLLHQQINLNRFRKSITRLEISFVKDT